MVIMSFCCLCVLVVLGSRLVIVHFVGELPHLLGYTVRVAALAVTEVNGVTGDITDTDHGLAKAGRALSEYLLG